MYNVKFDSNISNYYIINIIINTHNNASISSFDFIKNACFGS